MSAEYDDLFNQLQKFRLSLISLLTDMDAEIEALQQSVVSGKPINPERVQHLRNAVRMNGETFVQHNSRALPEFERKH